jgi:oligoendopeptidase F
MFDKDAEPPGRRMEHSRNAPWGVNQMSNRIHGRAIVAAIIVVLAAAVAAWYFLAPQSEQMPVAADPVADTAPASQEADAPESEIDPRYTWALEDVFASVEDWEAAGAAVEARISELEACEGHMGDSAQQLQHCLDTGMEIFQQYRLFSGWAGNHANEDTGDGEWRERQQRAGLMGSRLSQATSSQSPEILAIGEEQLMRWVDENSGLEVYRFYLENIVRQAPHTLSLEAEAVMSATGPIQGTPFATYSTFANAEIPWPSITLSDGTEIERLDQSTYGRLRQSPNRDDRQAVMEAFFGTLADYEGTIGNLLNGRINGDWFRAQSRNYETSLASAQSGPNVPEAVYRTLLEQVNENLPTLHRYFELRGRMLDVDDLAYYDIYPSLVQDVDLDFGIERGLDLTLRAVAPLGEDYVAVTERGFEERWMDVYPSPGKRSGAYMSGFAYRIHPYVLMNYDDTYNAVSTLAHEWGHAMHSYYSQQSQEFVNAGYPIFAAEIASNVNEVLLLDLVLSEASTDEERLFYLGNYLEQMRGSFFRQAMFAEFELAIHEEVEAGRPLTGQRLTEMYGEIQRRYHGHDEGVLRVDDIHTYEWMFIPHFYFNFYVYQYATSITGATALGRNVLSGDQEKIDQYLAFLSAGGSDYAYEMLAAAGVDLATPEPYQAAIAQMNEVMDQIETILDRRGM